jgi:hypothetical protein
MNKNYLTLKTLLATLHSSCGSPPIVHCTGLHTLQPMWDVRLCAVRCELCASASKGLGALRYHVSSPAAPTRQMMFAILHRFWDLEVAML